MTGLVAAVLLALAAGFLAARRLAPVRVSMHVGLPAPPGETITDFVLSPRGDLAAMIAFGGERESLWIHDFGTGKAREIENTETAYEPFWSPDGRWVAFAKNGGLYKVATSGGAPVLIHDGLGVFFGGTWAADDTILVSHDAGRAIARISASGGPLTEVIRGNAALRETGCYWPSFLPDGKHFLYLADADAVEDHQLYVASLDPKQPRKKLLSIMSNAVCAGGYLLYGKASALLAQAFDVERLELTGPPHIIADRLADTDFHHYVFSAAANGAIGFSAFDPRSRLHMLDRTGKEIAVFGEPSDWVSVNWSPDGRYASLERVESERRDGKLWLADLTRRSFNEFAGDHPSWGGLFSADSTRILYSTALPSHDFATFVTNVDGSQSRQIPTLKTPDFISSWVGDWVAIEVPGKSNPADVVAVSMSSGTNIPVATSPAWENDAALSPDGRWVAFNASGRIVIEPFPPTGAAFTVSSALGSHPRWRHDGRELYYSGYKGLFAVPIDVKGTSLEAGAPQLLFATVMKGYKNRPPYDVSPDGQRFLLNVQDSYERPAEVILDWTSMLH